ncbi:hypothetical protein JCM3770_003672, partial [Rhodotorula araucariae]
PCPACKANHWLQPAAPHPASPPAAEPAGALAALLDNVGVEGWLARPLPLSPTLRSPVLNSGALHSMCGDAALFANLRPCTPSPVGGISNQNGLKLNGALLVPGISTTLISSAQLYDLHGVTSTLAKHATLARNNVVLANGSRISRGLYRLDGELAYPSPSVAGASALLAASSSQAELPTWHQRLAHLAPRSLKSLSKSGDVTGLDIRLPFPHSSRSTSAPLELVHSDVLSVNVPSLSGRRYVVTFTDDFSRMLRVEPLARKANILAIFMRFKAAAKSESGRRLQRFRSDNGGEFMSHAFNNYLREHGIARETPPPYSPQSDGVAERVNRSIVEGIISLLNQAGAPKDLWAEALQAFVFVKNRSPHTALLGKVPLATWRGWPVRVDMLRVWGCRAWHTVTHGRSKLDDKAVPLVFIGYDGNTAAYRLLDPASRKIVRLRDARFVEHEFPLRESPTPSSGVPQQAVTPAFDLVISPGPLAPFRLRFQTPPPAHPHLERAAAPPPLPDSPDPIDFLDDPFGATLAQVEAMLAGTGDSLAAADDDFALPSSDPRNHHEAVRDVNSDRWREGEQDEFSSLRDECHVFHAVDRSEVPADAKVLGCRFIYRRKKDQQGRLTGHKVRLVAQGFLQRPGVDFRETFAPVAKFTSIRVLLALAARGKMHIHQADVDKAYLHGKLDKELYMRIPEGIDDPALAGKVLKLDRALYGLKQAGRVWNHRIHATLARLGYTRTGSDTCIYEEYRIKDLGEARFILGIQIHRCTDSGVFLSQRTYLEDVLLRLGQAGCRTAPTPMIPLSQLRTAPEDHSPSPSFRRRYLQAVGSLMYATLGTRPDLAHVVGVLGRHANRPDNSHWAAAVRVCQYLMGTLYYGIKYVPDDAPLVGFEVQRLGWGACVDTARSTMGYAFVLASGAVSWSSKLQPRVAASSTEAEYLGWAAFDAGFRSSLGQGHCVNRLDTGAQEQDLIFKHVFGSLSYWAARLRAIVDYDKSDDDWRFIKAKGHEGIEAGHLSTATNHLPVGCSASPTFVRCPNKRKRRWVINQLSSGLKDQIDHEDVSPNYNLIGDLLDEVQELLLTPRNEQVKRIYIWRRHVKDAFLNLPVPPK